MRPSKNNPDVIATSRQLAPRAWAVLPVLRERLRSIRAEPVHPLTVGDQMRRENETLRLIHGIEAALGLAGLALSPP